MIIVGTYISYKIYDTLILTDYIKVENFKSYYYQLYNCI